LIKIKVLEQQISDLKTEISTLNGTVDELEAENNLKDEQISNNEDKIKLMESEIEKLKNYTTDQVEDLTEEANVSES
jgi:peptidoglycan hydrolase CwlO-like protein